MKKKLILILILTNVSLSAKVNQDKITRAFMVYSYLTVIETTIETLYKNNPEFNDEVAKLNILYVTKFNNSKKNAFKYLINSGNWENIYKPKIDSLKKIISDNIIFGTFEEIQIIINEIEVNLKGNIPSPLFEYIISFEYENQPFLEFTDGYKFLFSTKGHEKSKNANLNILIPISWFPEEAKQTNVIQKFTSDYGYGLNSITLSTDEFINNKDFASLTEDEIDQFFKKEIFTEEYSRRVCSGKFISYKPMTIAGRAGFLVESDYKNEKIGFNFKMKIYQYIFHDYNYLHFINCTIGSENLEENLEIRSKKLKPLFSMILNSVNLPKRIENIIHLNDNFNSKTLSLKIGEKYYDFLLDTGATVSSINKNILNELLNFNIINKDNFIKVDKLMLANGEVISVEFWNIPELNIGNKNLKNIIFVIQDNNNSKPLIGMNILNQLEIWKIDLKNNKIYLKN